MFFYSIDALGTKIFVDMTTGLIFLQACIHDFWIPSMELRYPQHVDSLILASPVGMMAPRFRMISRDMGLPVISAMGQASAKDVDVDYHIFWIWEQHQQIKE